MTRLLMEQEKVFLYLINIRTVIIMKKIVICTFLTLGLLMLSSCSKGNENVSIKSVKNAAVEQISASLSGNYYKLGTKIGSVGYFKVVN